MARRRRKKPIPPRNGPSERNCAHCNRVRSHTDKELFCAVCQWLALRLVRAHVTTMPLVGPIVVILCHGVYVGLTAVHREALLDPPAGERVHLPPLSLNERFVAGVLHRQGRLIERSSS